MSIPENTSPTTASRTSRLTRPLSLLGLSFACILLAVLGGAAFAGYRAGLSRQDEQRRATQAIELKQQYDLGVADLASGRYALAAERFQYILSRDPNYPAAAEKLAEAREALNRTATPTPTLTPLPASQDPAEIFALAQKAYTSGDWESVIALLAQLHALDPTYKAVEADGMIFVALRNRGVARIEQGDEMEAGIFDLDQAEAFGPLDTEAVNYRAWARLYLAAQSYWGVNWEQTVQILQQLYVLAPNFQDTSRKYYQATLNYAAQLAAAGDDCAAAEQYAASQQLFIDPGIANTQATAQAACLLTPSPTATLDLTAVSATPPLEAATPTPSP
jgi:tetratricopeptide (TPR) repeat protein